MHIWEGFDTNSSHLHSVIPSNHMLYSKANCLVSNPGEEHWPNECTSNLAEFGTENNMCGRCLAFVILIIYTNLFPSTFVQCSCHWS